MACQTRLAPTV